MRYLSQLARETTARVLPGRTPSWAPALPLEIEENVVTWPAAPAEPMGSVRAEASDRAPSGGPQSMPARAPPDSAREAERTEGRAEPSETPRRRPPEPPQRTDELDLGPDPREAPRQRIAPRPLVRHPIAEESAEPMPPPAVSGRADRVRALTRPTSLPLRDESAPPRRDSPVPQHERPPPGESPRPAPPLSATPELKQRSGERPPTVRADLNSTLSLAFAEIARRQALLEARHREAEAAESVAKRPHPSSVDQAPTVGVERPRLRRAEPDEVRLSIGSIIVQADPPPAPPPRPPKPPRQSPRMRWARSFADR